LRSNDQANKKTALSVSKLLDSDATESVIGRPQITRITTIGIIVFFIDIPFCIDEPSAARYSVPMPCIRNLPFGFSIDVAFVADKFCASSISVNMAAVKMQQLQNAIPPFSIIAEGCPFERIEIRRGGAQHRVERYAVSTTWLLHPAQISKRGIMSAGDGSIIVTPFNSPSATATLVLAGEYPGCGIRPSELCIIEAISPGMQ
jgi:hypothetical protein